MESVTETELLQALQDALCLEGEDASTTKELARATGMSVNRVQASLLALKEEGKIECVRVMRTTVDDRFHPRPGYRLKQNP